MKPSPKFEMVQFKNITFKYEQESGKKGGKEKIEGGRQKGREKEAKGRR